MGKGFVVRGTRVDAPGAVIEQWIEAESAEQAQAMGQSRGLRVLSVAPAPTMARRHRLTSQDLAWWCRELRTLLAAGMTVVEALGTMGVQEDRQNPAGPRQRLQSELLQGLERGLALSQAMAETGLFPDILLASVRAAERTSGLQGALDDYLQYHETIDRLRRRVLSAAMYPLLVILVGALVCGFLLMYVMPRFMGILDGQAGLAGGGTGLVFKISQGLATHGWEVLVLVVLLLALLAHSWRLGRLQTRLLRIGQAMPPVARAIEAFQRARLYQTLALLYRGGFVLDEGLAQCARSASADSPERTAMLHAKDELERGKGIAAALHTAGLADEAARRLLLVGERAGHFDTVLMAIAQRHAQAFGDFVDRSMKLIEPVLLLLVASAVGSLVVLMYLPIFDIATGLQA